VKSKIRENPVLERFVSDMLLRGYSFRDVEKSVREQLHVTISRETIRKYYEDVFLPRLALSPPSKTETKMALLDLDEVMEKSVTKSEVTMLRYQIQALSVLEKRLLMLHEETGEEISARQLNAIVRATVILFREQDGLLDQYQKVIGHQKRMEIYRQKVRISEQSGQAYRRNPATQIGAKRPPVSDQSGHIWRLVCWAEAA